MRRSERPKKCARRKVKQRPDREKNRDIDKQKEWELSLIRCFTRVIEIWPTMATLQHTAARCSTLQHTAIYRNTPQHTQTRCDETYQCFNLLEEPARCNTLQHAATRCNTLQHTIKQRNTVQQDQCLQHAATHRNALQHTATHYHTPSLRSILFKNPDGAPPLSSSSSDSSISLHPALTVLFMCACLHMFWPC